MYVVFLWSDMIDLFLVTPVWVINCVLLFYSLSSSPIPTALDFILIVIILYSSWFVWCCSNELIGQIPELFFSSPNAETVKTDVALVMGFILFLFCVADLGLLCRDENIGCFPYFPKVTAVILSIIIDLWHRARNDSTVYFFHWYLFIGHLYVCFLYVYCFFVWRANRTQGRGVVSHWHFTIVYRKSDIVISHHTNKQSIK